MSLVRRAELGPLHRRRGNGGDRDASKAAFRSRAASRRFRPQQGVHGAPTIVNNTETLAHVPGILRNGAQWYRGLGIGDASGTKLYSLSGDVLRPGLYELPMGTSLEELVFKHGGGMLQGKEFKAVFTGGPSNTLLTKRDLDVALDFDSVRQRAFAPGHRRDDRGVGRHEHRPQGRGIRELLRPGVVRPVPAVQGRHLPADAAAQPHRHRTRRARRSRRAGEPVPHPARQRALRPRSTAR